MGTRGIGKWQNDCLTRWRRAANKGAVVAPTCARHTIFVQRRHHENHIHRTVLPPPRIRLVKITTDNGLVGWGETTLEGKYKSVCGAVEELAEYLVGKDPLRIEHHWQHIYRSAFFRGGNVLMSALSGIDQALWDIAGKHYGVPVHALLGGHVRDRLRVLCALGHPRLSEAGPARRQRAPGHAHEQGWLHGLQGRAGGQVACARAARAHRRVRQVRLHHARMGRPRRRVVL